MRNGYEDRAAEKDLVGGSGGTLWFIMYDIRSKARRDRIAELLADHGFRVQKSVFECLLSDRQFQRIWAELQKKIGERDSVLAVPVCSACMKQICRLGEKPWDYFDNVFYL